MSQVLRPVESWNPEVWPAEGCGQRRLRWNGFGSAWSSFKHRSGKKSTTFIYRLWVAAWARTNVAFQCQLRRSSASGSGWQFEVWNFQIDKITWHNLASVETGFQQNRMTSWHLYNIHEQVIVFDARWSLNTWRTWTDRPHGGGGSSNINFYSTALSFSSAATRLKGTFFFQRGPDRKTTHDNIMEYLARWNSVTVQDSGFRVLLNSYQKLLAPLLRSGPRCWFLQDSFCLICLIHSKQSHII